MTVTRHLSQAALDKFFDGVGRVLGRKERRANFALYAMGLLSTLERKSMEPIAALTAGDDAEAAAKLYGQLVHFTSASPWSDEAVRAYAAQEALPGILAQGPLDCWIVDDTGFLKQGEHSVGVKRQYTGTAGKVTNCQVAVSLTVATQHQHLPLDMDLYVPQEWIEDEPRRAEAKIPAEVVFRTKPAMALDLIARWVLEDVPKATLCGDSGYGHDSKFRGGVTQLGFEYALGVHSNLKVRRIEHEGNRGPEQSVEQLAHALPRRAYKKVAWAEGTKKTLASRFAWVRVELVNPDSAEPLEQGLLIEWPKGDKNPAHYTLVTLPKDTPLKEVVRKTKARWHIEGSYEDMKGELGLDHFEGRSWVGWNHHVSLVLACYALVIACKMRAFPPSATGTMQSRPDARANDAPFSRLLCDRTARPVATCRAMVADVVSNKSLEETDAPGRAA
jgi:SRSO17 transposase